ncbi:MAG: type II toxin-antitoxin system VapC family toxin [Pyrinomonadaceae bacterium]
MDKIIVDSDILIDLSRGDERAVNWIKKYENGERLVISVVTQIELLFGSRDKVHLKTIKSFLSNFETIQLNETISLAAPHLVEKYCLSHRLQLPDAMIAATALVNSFDLATINRKDFRFIEGLR